MTEMSLKDGLTAMDVASYLRRHPEFLKDFPDLALTLHVPREQGATTSLASYQLEVLRDKNRDLGRRLHELVEIAGENEQLMVRVHSLTVGLMRERTLGDTLKRIAAGLTEDFHTDLVRLVLFRAGDDLPEAEWLIAQPGGAGALPAFGEFIAAQRAAVRPPAARKARRAVRRTRGRRTLCRARADRRRRHAGHRQSRCEPLPSRHGHGVSQADRRSGGHRDRALSAGRLIMATDTLAAAVERYLDHLRVERRYARGTIVNYARALEGLVAYARKLSIGNWKELKPDQLRGWLARLHRGGLQPGTLHHMLSACRSFFNFLARDGAVAANPAAGVRSPKLRRKLPEVLDVDEVAALLDFPPDDPEAVRDRALFELLYSSGLRVSELTGVRWRDLDLGEGLVRVTGKGSKTRIVPVGGKALEALAALRGAGTAPLADEGCSCTAGSASR